jgi:hypothetical protein
MFYKDVENINPTNEAFKNPGHQENKEKMEGKGWILDIVEGVGALAVAGVILYGGWWLNNKIDENEANTNNKMSRLEDKVNFYRDEFSKQYLEVYETSRKNELEIDMLKKQIDTVHSKTAYYNISFSINEGGSNKDIKMRLSDEYMSKLFDDMDTIYNTVNEEGSVKINDTKRLYYIKSKLQSMDEFNKLKFKGLEIKDSLVDISELNIEKAE